ncbi:hypothetical protein WA026_012177 [Henosepilachna vigintioctopunctata]|uniref:Uncharacterized protein n=1 Tax=Henosepilachna vigintioctopunctata TaxID=420089 RepID=A0AAW1V560_9CUCU
MIVFLSLVGLEAVEGEVNVEAMTCRDSVKIPVAKLNADGLNNQVLFIYLTLTPQLLFFDTRPVHQIKINSLGYVPPSGSYITSRSNSSRKLKESYTPTVRFIASMSPCA